MPGSPFPTEWCRGSSASAAPPDEGSAAGRLWRASSMAMTWRCASLGESASIRAPVVRTRSVCEAAICYTGDILDPRRDKYPLAYYIRMAKELESMGAHILAIKDMAGLCRPFAAEKLVQTLRQEIGIPIHFHTHDTSGVNAASVLKPTNLGAAASAIAASFAAMTGPGILQWQAPLLFQSWADKEDRAARVAGPAPRA